MPMGIELKVLKYSKTHEETCHREQESAKKKKKKKERKKSCWSGPAKSKAMGLSDNKYKTMIFNISIEELS